MSSKWFYVNKNDVWVDEGEENKTFEHVISNVDDLIEVAFDPAESGKKHYKHSLKVVTKHDRTIFEFKDEATCRKYYAKLRELVEGLPEL